MFQAMQAQLKVLLEDPEQRERLEKVAQARSEAYQKSLGRDVSEEVGQYVVVVMKSPTVVGNDANGAAEARSVAGSHAADGTERAGAYTVVTIGWP